MKTFRERLEALDESKNDLVELNNEYSTAKNFMRVFDIGWKIKSFSEEPGVLGRIRKAIQKYMVVDVKSHETPQQLDQEMKDTVRKAVPHDEMSNKELDYKVNRIVRTEVAAIRELNKLLKWKKQGFTKVKHKTTIRQNTGKKDRQFNGKIFKIDYLLQHPQDRAPLHPNCRCRYTLWE